MLPMHAGGCDLRKHCSVHIYQSVAAIGLGHCRGYVDRKFALSHVWLHYDVTIGHLPLVGFLLYVVQQDRESRLNTV